MSVDSLSQLTDLSSSSSCVSATSLQSSRSKASAATLSTETQRMPTPRASVRNLEVMPSIKVAPDVLAEPLTQQTHRTALKQKLIRVRKKSQIHYQSLAQATLSNPELHLSSDPLLDSESPEHRRVIMTSLQSHNTQPNFAQSHWHSFTTSLAAHSKTTTATEILHTPPTEQPVQGLEKTADASPSGTFSGCGASHLTSPHDAMAKSPTEASAHTVAPLLSPFSLSLSKTLTLDSATSNSGDDSLTRRASFAKDSLHFVTKRKSATNWLRSKKWKAAIVGRAPTSSQAAQTQRRDARPHSLVSELHSSQTAVDDPDSSLGSHRQQILRQGSDETSIECAQDLVTSSDTLNLRKRKSVTSLGSDHVEDAFDERSIVRMRTARRYLYEELSKLFKEEIELDQEQMAQLGGKVSAEIDSSETVHATSQELLTFWQSISSGVLLCLLANHLKPGVIQCIDRRDVEWVRADNLSRFLRAARDFFRVRSKDLFHPLDLTDATVEGLDRAARTILAIQDTAKEMGLSVRSPSSPITSTVIHRVNSKRRSLIPPSPPSGYFSLVAPSLDGDLSHGSVSSIEATALSQGGATSDMTIDEHRRAAQAKLTLADTRPSRSVPTHVSRYSDSHRHKQNPPILLYEPRSPASANISFAEGSFTPRTSSEDDTKIGTLYRDRRMSESAISLKGVAEEEFEDSAQTNAHSLVCQGGQEGRDGVAKPPMSDVHRLSLMETDGRFSVNHLPIATGISRNDSQHRISREIALAQHGQGREWRRPGAASPPSDAARPKISHRYSGCSPSHVLSGQTSILIRRDSSPCGISVPFPLAPHTTDSSLIDSRSGQLMETSANGENPLDSVVTSEQSREDHKATRPIRPGYRHLRYTSELQLPVAQWGLSRSHNPMTQFAGNMRQISPDMPEKRRSGTEASSTTVHSTVGSKADGEPSQRGRSDSITVASRHKLSLVEEDGKTKTIFQVGNCIGRGQFGSVYRALNLTTGQMVAVKRIKFDGRSEAEVTQLMREVDLLKSLNHPSIVKYEGLVRGADAISIILEYVENGSLLHTLKAFGHLPEQLVASYVVKILEGLAYLHDMKVVHCDLKAANILTTKNGNVKLSDFGVSLNLQAMEKVQHNDALGTPNWMAPEVIELRGASTAADIWSLGCTIIELLTGKPPYGDMLAMSAMFRIVEDERPPIPERCSEELKDLLLQCFDKDPLKRPKAVDLFDHPWLLQSWSVYKGIRPQDSLPFLKRISSDAAVAHRLDILNLQTVVDEGEELSVPAPFGMLPKAIRRPAYRDLRSSSVPAGEVWTSAKVTALASMRPSSPTVYHIAGTATAQEVGTPLAVSVALDSPSTSETTHRQLGTEGEERPETSVKLHRFVKSTFSRTIRCKLCLQSVRKHAVFCEQCGLMCHARCARDNTSACDVRAQLLLFDRQEQEERRDVSTSGEGEADGATAFPTQPSNESQSIASPGLFSAGLKYAIARSRRLSKGQALDNVPFGSAPSSSDPSVGIEGDSPSLASDRHGQHMHAERASGLTSPDTQEGRDTLPLTAIKAVHRSSHGSDTKHTQSSQRVISGEPRRTSAASPDLDLPPDKEALRRRTKTSTIGLGPETYNTRTDHPKHELSQETHVAAFPLVSSATKGQERFRPIASSSRPTHRVSHSTSDLLTLQTLVLTGKVASSSPDVGLSSAAHSSCTHRTAAVSVSESVANVRQQQQQQQPVSPRFGPTVIGDKWRRRRTSSLAARQQREECAVM